MEVWKTISSLQEKVYDLSCTCTELKQDNKDLRQEIACLHEMLEKIKVLCVKMSECSEFEEASAQNSSKFLSAF